MLNQFLIHQKGIVQAIFETNIMLLYSVLFTVCVGLPLGILLFSLNEKVLYKNKILYQVISVFLNALRSVPFLIFIFVLIPVNRIIVGTGFGIHSSILPLGLVGVSLFSRFVEQSLLNVDYRIIQRAISMGATKFQILYYFLLPSIWADLVLSFTSIVISLVSYSTVMGVIGAGGLGDYAFRHGYQEYNYDLMYVIIIIFILYVMIIQNVGYLISKNISKNKGE